MRRRRRGRCWFLKREGRLVLCFDNRDYHKQQIWTLAQPCSIIRTGGFPALPAQPAWLLRLPAIRAAVSALSAPVLDRAALEEIFGVRRRRAIELLHRFGGYQAGKTFLVDRASLLGQLADLEAGGGFRQEQTRRRRLAEDLDRAKASLRARSVPIPAPRPAAAAGILPPGVYLQPGQLRIDFQGTEDLLRQLLELAVAIQEDYPRFDEICGS